MSIYEELKPNIIKVGDKLSFKAMNTDLSDFNSDEVKAKYRIISSVPSIDTGICFTQTTNFNKKIHEYKDFAKLITISRDLPFALNRACESFRDSDHIIVSDANYREFGEKTGLVIVKSQLLARSVMILNQANEVIYLQVVDPLRSEPNYNDVYKFLDKLEK